MRGISEMVEGITAGAYKVAAVMLVEEFHADDFLVELQGRLGVLDQRIKCYD